MSGQEEEQGIGRDVKVKIDQTVYQKGTTAEEAGEVERGGERFVDLQNLTERDEKKHTEEPCAADATGDSGFGELFEVVVVRVVDDFSVVLRLVGGKDGLQRAEAGPRVFVVEKDAPGILPHGSALAGGDF